MIFALLETMKGFAKAQVTDDIEGCILVPT